MLIMNLNSTIYFFPIQSLGLSIIHWKTDLASRFLEAIKNNIGNTPVVRIIMKISTLPKPISLIAIEKYKIYIVTDYIIAWISKNLIVFINFL